MPTHAPTSFERLDQLDTALSQLQAEVGLILDLVTAVPPRLMQITQVPQLIV